MGRIVVAVEDNDNEVTAFEPLPALADALGCEQLTGSAHGG